MVSEAQPLPYRAAASAALAPAGQPAPAPVATPGGTARPVPFRADAAAGHRDAVAHSPAGRSMLRSRLVALDTFAVAASWILVSYGLLTGSAGDRLAPGLAATAATLAAMRATGLYRSRLCVRRTDELWRVFLAGLWGAAAFVVVQWQTGSPGSEVLVAMAACVVLTGAGRWQFARWLRARRAEGRYLRNVVLVGANEDAASLRTMLRSEPELGYRVTAVVGAGPADPTWRGIRSSRSIGDIPDLAAATDAHGILVVPYALSSTATQRAIAVAGNAGLHVQVWPGFRGVGSGRLRHVPLSGEAFFYVEPKPSARWQFAVKRAVDVVGAAVVLTVAAPVLAVAALAVKLEDGGPVLYRDERVGMHGEPFCICKLRSMSVERRPTPEELAALNERTDGPLFKATCDPRVTRVGRLIRASSVDELPQLWNVLRGTMSLVGPRPALPGEVSQFDEDFQRRHSVRPGMTGLWQVEARQNPSFNAYRRLDLRYVDNWSLSLDLSIILTTVPSVASQALRSLVRHRHRRRHA
jgi:exopolysaccharide biosynthesis polyprenyl glycosylphosphotransferase